MHEMNQHRTDEGWAGLRKDYNPPPETPREEMWSAIEARLGAQTDSASSLEEVRRDWITWRGRTLRWATAAAAVLVLGVGIGRMIAPQTESRMTAFVSGDPGVLRVAAVDHLARTESLLTLIRADARAGRIEPALANWSRTLLSQTRLLMDAQAGGDSEVAKLLEDLELVLMQIVGVANDPDRDQALVRSETNLALRGLEESEVLSRIQAVIPAGTGRYGT
jgi:hypothetical protein